MSSYTIGELEELASVPRRTIYFYVQQGILPPPRGAGLAARYEEVHLARLRAIPHLRAQGRRLDEIRAFFEAHPEEHPPVATSSESRPVPAPITPPPAPEPVRRYRLAEGVELLVGADLDHERADRVRRLLQAAREIFR
jgi:DNA-binding transcriptional MerR regulator